MKRYLFKIIAFMVILAASVQPLQAQQLTIESMNVATMDLSASTNERKDNNGDACALVKVLLATPKATFKGNIVGNINFNTGEHWVYMPEGSYKLNINVPGYKPLDVDFLDYDIKGVEPKTTYTLVVLMSANQATKGILNVLYDPLEANISLDGKPLGKSPNVFRNIEQGEHLVGISMRGYQTKEFTIQTEAGKAVTLNGQLEKVENQSNVDTIKVAGAEFNIIFVEGGSFMMGNGEDEYARPVHRVVLSDFFISETEVTEELWTKVLGKSLDHPNGPQYPIDKMTQGEIDQFLKKLNQLTGRKFRLITEAEWEYAARGGKKSKGYKYSGSNDIDSVAWYNEYNQGKGKPHKVKLKQPNELGIYDMTGNVLELCQDHYDIRFYEKENNMVDPVAPLEKSGYRVSRGGYWGISSVEMLENTYRYQQPHYTSHSDDRVNGGLRLVCPTE